MTSKAVVVAADERRLGGLIAVARKVCDSVEAVVVGSCWLAETVSHASVDGVTWIEPSEQVPPEAYALQVANSVAADTQLVVSNDGPAARMLLGAVAGKLKAAVVGDAIDVAAEADSLVAKRMIAGGRAVEQVSAKGALAAIYVGDDEECGESEAPIRALEPEAAQAKVVGFEQSASSGLADAHRIVAVGIGIASRENIPVAQELADALDAQIACTLPCCDDMNWFGADRVIGSSHNSASPDLYIALGISGSPNHTSGFRDAACVVAVNNDPEAEIFQCADYGIVGDLLEMAPALTAALR